MATFEDNTPFSTAATGGSDLNETLSGQPGDTGAATTRSDELLARVVQGAHDTIDRLAETAAPHVHRLSEGVQTGTGQVREMSDEWTESLRSTVRENPLAAVTTAVVVGLLIARITR